VSPRKFGFVVALALLAALLSVGGLQSSAAPRAQLPFASASTPQQAAPQQSAQFVASTRGRVYYWIGCDAWRQLSAANLRYFATREEAERAGLTASRSRGCAGPGAPAVGASAPRASTPSVTLTCVVSRVIDGDTVACEDGLRVRLLLVDAPEMNQGSFGRTAKEFVERLAPRGTVLALELDVQRRDPYGRTLAYARTPDGAMLNEELVRAGMAVVSVYPPNVKHVERLRAISDSARVARRGLWSVNAFECPPSDHRAGRCR